MTRSEVRCTARSAACACASVLPRTTGTVDVYGPAETKMATAEPFLARPAGLVPATRPFCTVLLWTVVPAVTEKPLPVSAVVASATVSPATLGTAVYWPAVNHQPPTPRPPPRITTSATMISRGLNSQRCRNDSRLRETAALPRGGR